MFFIPFGSDHKRTRFPRFTVGLIIACTVIYVIFFWAEQVHWSVSSPEIEKLSRIEYDLMIRYLKDQGDREPEKTLLRKRYNPVEYYKFEQDFRKKLEDGKVVAPDSPEFLEWRQASDDFEHARRRDPAYIFGYVPADPGIVSLFTSMFLHGDFWHLFWNMVFLWLAGANLEDVWGRRYYAAVYFAGGVAASFTHQAVNMGSYTPSIGASGAIAALMGAYTYRFARSRLRFATFTWSLWVPAWIPLLFWFFREFYYGVAYWGQDLGVAVWAHIGGFIFGLAAAVAIVRSGVERSLIAETLARQDKEDGQKAKAREMKKAMARPPARSPELKQAIEARQYGRHDQAEQLFREAIAANRFDFEAREELIRFCLAAGRTQDAAREMGAMAEACLVSGARDQALAWYQEVCRLDCYAAAAGPWLFGIARELEARAAYDAAVANYRSFASVCPQDARAPKALFLAASLLSERMARPGEAVAVLDQIKASYPEWMSDQVVAAAAAAGKKAGK